MDAKTIKLQKDADGHIMLQLPQEFLDQLKLSDSDEVDLIPTASGFEVRKVDDEAAKKFWDPFSETLNEYERALKFIKNNDEPDDVSSK
ncbi:hypothetical protein [uncultured Secundilactobacillus sp.]|uniref:hypothetical protein n=1 Tax=uncultured Secundilactobacillus sp. TaxID=2813935 RepID=UPI00258FCB2F|nr:hypothetical protein [uncultured Secundilactobacillus sp.]